MPIIINSSGGGNRASPAKAKRAVATVEAIDEAIDDEVAKVFEGDDGFESPSSPSPTSTTPLRKEMKPAG